MHIIWKHSNSEFMSDSLCHWRVRNNTSHWKMVRLHLNRQSCKFRYDGPSHIYWESLTYSDSFVNATTNLVCFLQLKTRAKRVSLVWIILTFLLLTFIVPNVHSTPGFRRTDAAAQLCALLSTRNWGHLTDETKPLWTRTPCCIKNHNSLDDHKLVRMYLILFCREHITAGFLLLTHLLTGFIWVHWVQTLW